MISISRTANGFRAHNLLFNRKQTNVDAKKTFYLVEVFCLCFTLKILLRPYDEQINFPYWYVCNFFYSICKEIGFFDTVLVLPAYAPGIVISQFYLRKMFVVHHQRQAGKQAPCVWYNVYENRIFSGLLISCKIKVSLTGKDFHALGLIFKQRLKETSKHSLFLCCEVRDWHT